MKSKMLLLVLSLCLAGVTLQAQLNREWLNSYPTADSTTYASVIGLYDAGNGNVVKASMVSQYVPPAIYSRLLLQWFSPAGTLMNQVSYEHPVYDGFRLHNGGRDAAGNLYFSGHLVLDPSNTGWFVVSFDGNGQFRWEKHNVGGSAILGEAHSMAVSAAGNVYVGGYAFNTDYNGYIVKYDSNGNELWNYPKPTDFGFAQSLTLAGNGDVLAINSSNLIRINAAGVEQWTSLDSGYYAQPAILEAADGNIYTLTYEGYLYHLRQFTSTGTLEWEYDDFAEYLAFGDYSVMLASDAQSNVYAAGINSTDTSYSTAVGKFSPQGQLLWLQKFDNSEAHFYDVYNILLLPSGNLALSGVIDSPTNASATALLNGTTGAVIGIDSVVISNDIMFNQKMVFNSGGLYVAGGGNYGTHILKYGASLSVGEEQLQPLLEVFPNPFTESVTVRTDFVAQRYEIRNLAGQTVAQGKPAQNGLIVLDGLAAGAYLLRLEGEGKQAAVQKIIKR